MHLVINIFLLNTQLDSWKLKMYILGNKKEFGYGSTNNRVLQATRNPIVSSAIQKTCRLSWSHDLVDLYQEPCFLSCVVCNVLL
jgi:hypothetical protein